MHSSAREGTLMTNRRPALGHSMPARALERRRRLLKRGLYLLDRRFLRRPHQYMMQALLAAMTLFILVAVEDALTNAAAVTAIASSAFIIFMAPHSTMAGPRRVLGGHAVGLAIGLPAFLLADRVFGGTTLAVDVTAAAAVGLSMLVMASTDTEHPPAAGTVLGLVLASDPLKPALMVLLAALALSAARHLFGRWMIDLAH
jgi:CBS-domain-containing membrane protein